MKSFETEERPDSPRPARIGKIDQRLRDQPDNAIVYLFLQWWFNSPMDGSFRFTHFVATRAWLGRFPPLRSELLLFGFWLERR
ncbi:MAG: hypothetical protein ACPGXX_16670 [Planctomycetaceae bacterium]